MIIFLSLICLLAIESPAALAASSALAPDETKIIEQAVFQPLNRFLLIQRGEYLGAVIFDSFEKNDKGEFTHFRAFRSSPTGWQPEKEDAIGIRELKWWEYVLGIMGIHTPPLSRIKPLELKGITLMANPSPDGKHAIVYFGPPTSLELDPAIRLAPTPWREIKEVNEKDGRLKWFSAYSPELTAKIDKLWK
jgi:hypothetical protein